MAEISQLPGIEVFAIDSIEQLVDCLPHRSKYFTLLLAWDAPDLEMEKLKELFRPLVDRGLVYLCAWGCRSEDVHDAVDLCVVEKELSEGEADYLLMTTWHHDETIEEALWFFQMNAIPAENRVVVDFSRSAVSVGNPEWADTLKNLLSSHNI
ncbi:MAG: hypothetical protein ABSC48_10900 [Terracidiphilus sp.]|jgi:hypothetical protein